MADPLRDDLSELARLLATHAAWQRELGALELPREGRLPVDRPTVEAPPEVAAPVVAAPTPAVQERAPTPPAAPPAAPAPAFSRPAVAPPTRPAAVVAPVAPVVRTLFGEPAAPPPPPRISAGPPLEGEARVKALAVIQEEVRACTACRLAPTRRNTVFARGNPFARLFFIGEGPGEQEDKQGLPFVGPAGQLLDKIIVAMGLQPDDVYVGNIVKCLRYTALVQLENGGWERIGRLVRQRYAGRVMSMAPDGRLVKRRVTGWHESPLGARRVFKLSYAHAPARGGRAVSTWLTEDHPVMTARGWVEARDLTPDDQVAVGQGLSRAAYEMIVGSLLGDASINALSSHLEMAHCRDQREYVALKARVLTELRPIVFDDDSTARDDGRRHLTTRCRTLASRALRVLRAQFYGGGRKCVPSGLRLTPRILAAWFLDDGYTRVRSANSALAEIAAHAFLPSEIDALIERLRVDLGVVGYTRESSPGRIHFGAEATRSLAEVIAPLCPPTMRYKLPPQVEAQIPYDPTLWDPAEPETLYDTVRIEPVDFKGTDRTFFCIDVDETHNFVTSGGVVHNCRPPNNRVPEHDEMRACTPFLVRQLDLVRPEVIVALGRTAVSFLLDSKDSMSRLRGKWHSYEGIPVLPTWHPAYLLRTPEAKADTWADMKVVMARLGLPLPTRGGSSG